VEEITLMRIERNLHGLKNQPTGKKKNIERVEDLERRTIKLAV
jgi:hypothetical protein